MKSVSNLPTVRAAALLLLVLATAAGTARAQVWCDKNQKPGPARSVRVKSTGDTTAEASWKDPAGYACVDGYSWTLIEKNVPQPRTFPPIVSKTYSVQLTDLKVGADYTFTVTPVGPAGNGPPISITFTHTKPPCNQNTKPGAAQSIYVIPTSDTSLLATWQPPPTSGGCATSYKVEAFQKSNNKRVLSSSTTLLSAEAKGLLKYEVYRFVITPANKVGSGPTSEALGITANCDLAQPDAITNLKAVPSTTVPGLIQLTWGPAKNGACVDKYKVTSVFTSQSSETDTTGGNPAAGGAIDFQGLGGTSYTFDVVAVGMGGKLSAASRTVATAAQGGFVPSGSSSSKPAGFKPASGK